MGRILGGGGGGAGLEKGGNAPRRLRIHRDVNPPKAILSSLGKKSDASSDMS